MGLRGAADRNPIDVTLLLRSQRQLAHGAGEAVPTHETCRLPLGFLSAGMHVFCGGDCGVAVAEWVGAAGAGAYG